MEVVTEFGKNFGFISKNMDYYELLIDVYSNRNYLYTIFLKLFESYLFIELFSEENIFLVEKYFLLIIMKYCNLKKISLEEMKKNMPKYF